MAQFDVLGFIRDLGDRTEAKKLIAANRDVLASGNPDAIQGLVAHAPTNQHYVGALKNVYDNLMSSSALKTQSTGRLATRAGTDQTEAQTAGINQDVAHKGEQYNWLKEGRQNAINQMPGGMPATPEAVKMYTDMLNQYTGVAQNERNVDLTGAHVGNTNANTGLTQANTGLTNAHTSQVFGQENRANEDQTRRVAHEDAFASMVGAPGTGPYAEKVKNLELGSGHLAEMIANNSAHTNLANKEFGLKSVQDLGAMLTNPAFMPPGQPNVSDAVKRQLFDQFGQVTGLDLSHMGPATPRPGPDPAAIVRAARAGQTNGQPPVQPQTSRGASGSWEAPKGPQNKGSRPSQKTPPQAETTPAWNPRQQQAQPRNPAHTPTQAELIRQQVIDSMRAANFSEEQIKLMLSQPR